MDISDVWWFLLIFLIGPVIALVTNFFWRRWHKKRGLNPDHRGCNNGKG